MVDVPGDLFAPDPFELTRDARAIERQRRTIDEFHALGVEVVMSSHVCKFLPEAEVVELALEHQRRGADIAKFVTYSGSEAELDANFQTIRALKREPRVPFLFLSNGPYCKKQPHARPLVRGLHVALHGHLRGTGLPRPAAPAVDGGGRAQLRPHAERAHLTLRLAGDWFYGCQVDGFTIICYTSRCHEELACSISEQ